MEEIKLDMKDRRLLFALDFHARDSNASIARKVRLSKQGVDYKIRNLARKGVIKGFSPVINGNKLGYFYCRLLIKFQNITKEKMREISSYFVSYAKCKWMLKAEGCYDLLFATWTSSLTEFKQISEEVAEKFGAYISEKRESIGVKLTHFQARYLTGRKECEACYFTETSEIVKIDETDRKILAAIAEDARMPLMQIGEKAGISAKVASYRLKRLQNESVILGYRPNIDNSLIGYKYYKVLFHLTNVTQKQLSGLKGYLALQPEVMYMVEEIGISDIDIEAMLPKGKSIFEFVDQIKFEFPILIKDYEAFSVNMEKVNLLPF